MRLDSRTFLKALRQLARTVWIVFFFTAVLGGFNYLIFRDEMGLAICLGSLMIAALPWGVDRWIAGELRRMRPKDPATPPQ